MFKKKFIAEGFSIIFSDTIITGEIDTTNHLRVDGKIKGNIKSNTHVIISEAGLIHGEINSSYLTIYGKVIGNIHVENMVAIGEKGSIEGDVIASVIRIEEGGKISGKVKVKMSEKVKKSG